MSERKTLRKWLVFFVSLAVVMVPVIYYVVLLPLWRKQPENELGPPSQIGSLALEILRENPPKLVLEIDYEVPPDNTSLNMLKSFILNYTDTAVEITQDAIEPGEISDIGEPLILGENGEVVNVDYAESDLHRVEERLRNCPEFENDVLCIWISYLDGTSQEYPNAVAVTASATSIVVFKIWLERREFLILGYSATRFEASILIHEFGHVLSLVEICYQSDMDYWAEGNHSSNPESVMYGVDFSKDIINLNLGPEEKYDIKKLREGEYEFTCSYL